MRSVLKFLLFGSLIIIVPTIIMLILSLFGESTALVFIGQILVIISLMGLFLLFYKKQKAYEKETLDKIEREDDIEKLKSYRDQRISYRSKAEITKRILDLEYSEEEMANLKKYGNRKTDMDTYYSKLVKEDRKNRDDSKKRRAYFNKRFKNKGHVYLDFKDVLLTAIKWTIVFLIFTIPAVTKVYYKFMNPYMAYILDIILFVVSIFLTVNTIIWIVRALRAFWFKDHL